MGCSRAPCAVRRGIKASWDDRVRRRASLFATGRGERRLDSMVDIVAKRRLESAIKRILFVEPQSGYSTGFNDTVRVETLGPEYLAGSVADVAECRMVDLRTTKADLHAT